MALALHLYVPNAGEMLNASWFSAGAKLYLESSTTETGTYAAVGTGTALVDGTLGYTVYHSTGTTATWYRSRYGNSGGTAYSDYSQPWMGDNLGLCSLYDVRARRNPDDPDATDEDGLLLAYIAAATDYIHELTQPLYFLVDNTTYTYDGSDGEDGGSRLWIPRGLRTVTTLKIATGGTGSTLTAVASDHYVIRPKVQDRLKGWPGHWLQMTEESSDSFTVDGYDVIEIAGTGGFAAVPEKVREIAAEATIRAWRRRPNGADVMMGELSSEVKYAMSLDAKTYLRSLKPPRVS